MKPRETYRQGLPDDDSPVKTALPGLVPLTLWVERLSWRFSPSPRIPVPGNCPPGLSHTGLRGLLGDLLGFRPRLILSVQRKQSLKTSSSLLKREKGFLSKGSRAETAPLPCENHARKDADLFHSSSWAKDEVELPHLLVWRCGLATTGKRLVVWKRAKNRNHFGRNSPSALWPCVAKLSILKHMICPEGSFPSKIRQLLENASSAIDPAVARNLAWPHWRLHHACLEKFSVLPSPFCGWACAGKEKDFLACLPPLSLKRQVSLGAKVGSCAVQQRTDFTGHLSNSGWCAIPWVGYIQWNSWNFGKFVAKSSLVVLHKTPGFWILPLYRELLNSARRNRPSAASERARGLHRLG